mgnify:FL=1
MPLPTSSARRFDAGFTLIEVLAVVFVVGIVASLAALSVGDGAERQLRTEAQRMAGALKLARDELLITGAAERALGLRPDSYSFLELVILDDATREWRPLVDPQLGIRQLEGDVLELSWEEDGDRRSLPQTGGWEPHIRLGNTGEMTPGIVTLKVPGKPLQKHIRIGMEGSVEVLDALPE